MKDLCPDSRCCVVGKPSWLCLAMTLFFVGVAATAYRTVQKYQVPGPFDSSNQGLCDFHNGIYFPTNAFLRGLSPYSEEFSQEYPVARQIPFYSPAILALHTPLAIVPLRIGEILSFGLSVALVFVTAWVTVVVVGIPIRLDLVFAVAACIVFSRSGHVTLFTGYFTFELVLASLLAIHWGPKRPGLSAIALAVVAIKPTYILPLGMLMFARGNVKALALGAILSILTTGVSMTWLAMHYGDGSLGDGFMVLLGHIQETQEIHRGMFDESPVTSWTRLDSLAVFAKWTNWNPAETLHLIWMMVYLIPGLVVLNLRRLRGEDDGVAGMTGALVITFMLSSLYHQSYDAMVFAAPILGCLVASGSGWIHFGGPARGAIAGLMLLPAFNYLSTRMFLQRIAVDQAVVKSLTSISGVSIVILAVLLVFIEIQRIRGDRQTKPITT